MFSSALKSLTSNISGNYSVAPTPSSTTGYWKIYDAKKRSGGKIVSVFIFDRKLLDPNGSAASSRSGAVSLKKAHDEVVDRLKKEAASLARLRHPSILELVEPVEETRNGGLMFATEPVTTSLAGLLEEKDEQEKAGGIGGRSSRFVVEDPDGGGRRRREIEIDELEVQKGLLQLAKGLQFLHESAGLVHANLSPDAIFINLKGDWKISGLGFSSPPDHASNGAVPTLILAEALNYDARLPRSVQLNMDYASPDFVMDSNITTSADMFSLGLIVIALYNSPHRTPFDTGFSTSNYKRILTSASTTPTQSNNYLSSRPIPRELVTNLLPRLITRRPAQRYGAREFQEAAYFDSILVSTIRFLDTLPAKTPNEKSQFLRGLPRILPQFPKSVLEKKVLPALLEETKDYDLLSLIFQNVFKIVELVPNGKRTFGDRVIPTMRDIFLTSAKGHTRSQNLNKESSKEGGLLVLLEHMPLVTSHCSGKEFKDYILPILFLSLESPTHSIQDASLQCLPSLLSFLDFSTVKNELFPAVAHVFSKTSSMSIKIKGLEALSTLCGGQPGREITTSQEGSQPSGGAVLDKYTIQEKVVPLLKAIKTKEPAVMMAALDVFRHVGRVGDLDFLAMEALPCLWQFSLGPLLNLEQFQAFMDLIKTLSKRIEQEQTRKLQNFSSSTRAGGSALGGKVSINGGEETDFESLVTGRKHEASTGTDSNGGWHEESKRPSPAPSRATRPATNPSNAPAPAFAWSSASPAVPEQNKPTVLTPASAASRTVTPDVSMNSFAPLKPSSTANQPMNYIGQGTSGQVPKTSLDSTTSWPNNTTKSSMDWSRGSNSSNVWSTPATADNPWPISQSSYNASRPAAPTPSSQAAWGSQSALPSAMSNLSMAAAPQSSSWAIPRPPAAGGNTAGTFGQTEKQGMDKYESLL